ncbi:helix-turn-helix domain-containing protein [Patiriisocius hiemis]|uniref:Helix-turn-helix transcriptional regulator n=1 Tax=Patiriisocius hiemis TaxID=3075604 RepID=A0ABU2Y9N3_9FLAO|nr:helix-turn-helix transcriptional regulator [Constantimarinum sp. W242]MDT0554896.1 helix-turn-helix transcriptional regulator [Constantimarinum sp. W242]
MVNSKEFTKRLEKIIDFYGLSATAFSEKIDFNRSTISHLLSGRNKPSLEFVMKVVQTFPEVELYWLLNGKGSFPSESKTVNQNLFSDTSLSKNEIVEQKQNLPSQNTATDISKTTSSSEIDRIVIFYKDGTFKAYSN